MAGTQESLAAELAERFGSRYEPGGEAAPGTGGRPLASVKPLDAAEVQDLARIAERYRARMVAAGAATVIPPEKLDGAVLVRSDFMRQISPVDPDGLVRAGPGAQWTHLEDELKEHGRGLCVYPTSAPVATLGGWVAQDGLGVGSFEYGWLRENLAWVEVVLTDGRRRQLSGAPLADALALGALIVEAALMTREASRDQPFALAFDTADQVHRAVQQALSVDVPLWHLAFQNPALTRARGSGDGYVLLGAYPEARASVVRPALENIAANHGGQPLGRADLYRLWGGRFFPAIPSRKAPGTHREIIEASRISAVLRQLEHSLPDTAVQGTVARSQETLLLAFGAPEGSIEDISRRETTELKRLAGRRRGRSDEAG